MIIDIVRANTDDVDEILDLQKIAFQSEAKLSDDYEIPPLMQTVAEMVDDMRKYTYLKAVVENKIVGAVRAYTENGLCYIGRLIVSPHAQNQGLGTRLMNEIEAIYDNVSGYDLFTGKLSKKNIYLYEKLGYSIYDERVLPTGTELVYMKKEI